MARRLLVIHCRDKHRQRADAFLADVMQHPFLSIVPDKPAHKNIHFFGGGKHEEKLDHHNSCRFVSVTCSDQR
jgi:hypothetical protein